MSIIKGPASTALGQHLRRHFSGSGFSAREVFAVLNPVIVDNVFLMVIDIANTAIISSSGASAIAAVILVTSINVVMLGTLNSVGLGATVLVAQCLGAGERRRMGRTVAAAFRALAVAVIVYLVLGLAFHRPVLEGLFGSVEAAVMEGAQLFLAGVLASLPAFGVIAGVNGVLRGIGQTRATLVLSLFTNLLRILLSLLFVSLLGYGIWGLVLAVLIAEYLGAAASVVLVRRYRHELALRRAYLRQLDLPSTRRVFEVSMPFIIEDLLFNGAKLVIQTFMVGFGTVQLAAHAIIAAWLRIGEVAPRALAVALVPIAGRSLGSGDTGFARRITRTFVVAGAVGCLVINLALLPVFSWAMRDLFHAPAESMDLLWVIYLMGIFCYPLLFSPSSIIPAVLRSAGDGPFTTVVSLASMWFYRILAGYFVSVVLGYQLVGLWAVWMTEWGIRAIVFWLRYRGTKWQEHRLLA